VLWVIGIGKKKLNLGVLLIDFLDYYGRKFDYDSTGITISSGGYFYTLRFIVTGYLEIISRYEMVINFHLHHWSL
jgi:DNA polymerase sigma